MLHFWSHADSRGRFDVIQVSCSSSFLVVPINDEWNQLIALPFVVILSLIDNSFRWKLTKRRKNFLRFNWNESIDAVKWKQIIDSKWCVSFCRRQFVCSALYRIRFPCSGSTSRRSINFVRFFVADCWRNVPSPRKKTKLHFVPINEIRFYFSSDALIGSSSVVALRQSALFCP